MITAKRLAQLREPSSKGSSPNDAPGKKANGGKLTALFFPRSLWGKPVPGVPSLISLILTQELPFYPKSCLFRAPVQTRQETPGCGRERRVITRAINQQHGADDIIMVI